MKAFAIFTSLAVAIAASSGVSAAVLGAAGGVQCANETVVSETFIGPNKDVKMTTSRCNDAQPVHALINEPTDVCDAQCDTNCFNPAGGGPNEADCAVIAGALLYESDPANSGDAFYIPLRCVPGSLVTRYVMCGGADHARYMCTQYGPTNRVTMQYHSCETYFLNQARDANGLSYCRSDWITVLNYIASTCDAAHDAHGGNCVAADEKWYIQYVSAFAYGYPSRCTCT
ncbi:hypothetical protein BD413DRAFT_613435 [Trametes elegans]|nr:hypothetical protein BD413DRAFT_613435 [Trametes elegans]